MRHRSYTETPTLPAIRMIDAAAPPQDAGAPPEHSLSISISMSRQRRLRGYLLGLGVLLGGAATLPAGGCRPALADPALTQLAEARRLAADMRVKFANASSASDRAVMADTDEASIAFAREAEQTLEAVEANARALAPRLESLGYGNEARFLDQFRARFAEYRKLERDILQLAVENTNLKAQRLSFGPVREAADAFHAALETISRAAPAKDRCRTQLLAAEALLAVRQIQVLQAPHIAEPNDAAMDRLEKDMAGLEASAHDALTKLGELIVPATQPARANATAALARFEGLARQIVTLSRRNSNVRSLSLSLGQKPALTAACNASLTALGEALEKQGWTGTR
jgi:hypothetical protein